jgi:hypothetical protein
MKTGKTYWETEQIGEKERQREKGLGREGQQRRREKMVRVGFDHRHLRNIDWLMAGIACLVCFISTVNGRSKRNRKRKEAY